jgi:hypothetical protein
MKRRYHGMRSAVARSLPLAIGLLVGGTALVLAQTLKVGVDSSPSEPAQKQAIEQAEASAQAAALAGPHGLKVAIPAPQSCPSPTKTGILAFQGGPFSGGNNLVNVASLTIEGAHYFVFAGASDSDASAGEVRVWKDGGEDKCAEIAGKIATHLRVYPAPPGLGAITLTQIAGTAVRFTTSTGASGSFAVASGAFGP